MIKTEEPIILKMRKKSRCSYVGQYVEPESGFISEGYKEFVSTIISTPWGAKVRSFPRGGETHVSYKSPVYKPLERLMEEDFQGPFEQGDYPLMEKIIYKKQKIYFGIINDKLATFSVSYNQKGEKQMVLYNLRKVGEKENNREYLRAVAEATLTDLMRKEISRLEDNKKRLVSAFKMNWPEYKMYDAA